VHRSLVDEPSDLAWVQLMRGGTEGLDSDFVSRAFRARGESGGGEGVRVVLLDPLGHFFADQAAEVEVFAGVARAHEAAELHGAVGEVGDL